MIIDIMLMAAAMLREVGARAHAKTFGPCPALGAQIKFIANSIHCVTENKAGETTTIIFHLKKHLAQRNTIDLNKTFIHHRKPQQQESIRYFPPSNDINNLFICETL